MATPDGSSHEDGSVSLWSAGAVFLLAESGGYTLPLLLEPISRTYDLAEGTVGLVFAVQLAAFTLAAIAISPRLPRFSPRYTVLMAMTAITAGNLLSAAQPQVTTLFLGRSVTGLGEGVAASYAALMIARLPNSQRAFARVFTAIVLMAMVIYIGLPEVIAGRDARLLFLGLAVTPLLALPWVLRLPTYRFAVEAEARHHAVKIAPVALLVCVALSLYSVSANAPWYYLERIAANIGMAPATFGQLIALSAVLSLLGPLAADWLGMRAGYIMPVAAACTLVGGGCWLATNTSVPLLYALGFGMSSAALLFGAPYFMGLAAELDPGGRAAGAARGFNALGSTLAPALAGAILTTSGGYNGIGVASIVGAALAFSLVLVALSRRSAGMDAAEQVELNEDAT